MALFKPYVKELKQAMVDTLILAKVHQGVTTQDQIEREVQRVGIDLADVNVRDRIAHLDHNGHVEREGDTVRLTDDGREDIAKAIPWFREISQELGRAETVGVTTGMR